MKKRYLAILLAVCIIASIVPAAFATGIYSDVAISDWYAGEVMYVYGNGIMNGIDTDKFAPKAGVTRAMVWTTLARLEGVDTSGSDPWYLAGQQWAMENGVSDGTMALENVTREQLVTMLYRYAQLKMYDVSVGEDTNILSYEDVFSVSEWAIEAFQWACGAGVITGVDGKLLPKQGANRAELAVMLYRFDKTTVGKYEPTFGDPCYFTYTYNGDSTHIGVCSKCGIESIGKCQYDKNNICKICGAPFGLPVATVVNSNEYENVDLPWGSYSQWSPTEGLDAQLEAAYTFSCQDTPEEAAESLFADWYCDFYVKLDRDLGSNQIFLGGHYGIFEWVGFHNGDFTIEAGEEIGLLTSVGGTLTYKDVVNSVGTFICGVGDVDDALSGATFTVSLRLTNPENPDEYYDVSTINYTFE